MHDAACATPACLRLIGATFCTRTGSAVEHLLSLRAGLGAANRAKGLRTALLYTGGWLVQWIEGPAEAVEQAWRAAQADPSLRDARLLHRSLGPASLPDPVQIATLHGRERPADVARRLIGLQKQEAQGWRAEPSEVWLQLSAPTTLPGADAVCGLARRDVVAMTSEDNESVDLLRGVAQRCATPVSYQRFALGDPRAGDVGAAYADIACGAHVTRVQALSRRALSHALVRIALGQLQSVVLLLGARPRASASLAESVADLLAALPQRPAVHLVGVDSKSVVQATTILQRVPGLRITHGRAGPTGRASLDDILGLTVNGRAPESIDLQLA